jgi:hypothetical protein
MLLIHQTWKLLAFKGTNDLGKENLQLYLNRINTSFPQMPNDVLGQWIYQHQRNPEIIKLYGWIDYSKAQFKLVKWSTEKILKIKTYSEFSQHTETYKHFKSGESLEQIGGSEIDRKFWLENGTWRTPIIVLDTDNIITPENVKLERPYQLVEGHTRLGWLMGFNNSTTPYKCKAFHNVWLMSCQ